MLFRSKRFKTYLCSDTRGDILGPVVVDDIRGDEVWTLAYGEKKLVLGEALRAVGGPTEGEDDLEDEEMPTPVITGETMVPFAWLSFPKTFFLHFGCL